MKPILILVVSILCLAANAQVESKNDKISEILNSSVKWKNIEYDTVPTVEYVKTNNKGKEAAFLLMGSLLIHAFLQQLNQGLLIAFTLRKKKS